MPTNLLTTQQQTLLASWLKETDIGEYELCWNSSMKSFYSQCAGKPQTITILKPVHQNNTNQIYGGYTDLVWKRKLI